MTSSNLFEYARPAKWLQIWEEILNKPYLDAENIFVVSDQAL